jgi:hypothetical protein
VKPAHAELILEAFEDAEPLSSLPLRERIMDRLLEIVILTDELRAEFSTEEANPLLWLEPQIDRIMREVDAAVGRLAS